MLRRLAKTSSTDEERLASLLVLTKIMSPDNEGQIVRLHASAGTAFIDRLLRTGMLEFIYISKGLFGN